MKTYLELEMAWQPTPHSHWIITQCVAQSMSAPSGACEQRCFVWDSTKIEWPGSSHHLTQQQHHYLLLQSMSASSGAGEQICFVWDNDNRKW